MKVVILAGGLGTRLAEETTLRPKPMVEIGDKPILWHIMKIYSAYGFNEFIICLGYKGAMIRDFFLNYRSKHSDITINTANDSIDFHRTEIEKWKVTVVDTGRETLTGGRIKRISEYIDEDNFMLTYGDGVADINIDQLMKFHMQHKGLATVTAVIPPARFGALEIENDQVLSFNEKQASQDHFINGGFFVLNRKVFDYIDGDDTIWERDPMQRLADENSLYSFRHKGFWQPM
ncbi:MAG: glucose-1-phosphate cytidylyltransferase, partial [Pseudomonadota bacterium]